jgi:hypothetical protein
MLRISAAVCVLTLLAAVTASWWTAPLVVMLTVIAFRAFLRVNALLWLPFAMFTGGTAPASRTSRRYLAAIFGTLVLEIAVASVAIRASTAHLSEWTENHGRKGVTASRRET